MRNALLHGGVSLVLLAPASAQVPSALLREGDPLAGSTVSSISNTAVNQVGGYAITLNDAASVSHVWGAANGGVAPTILRSEDTILGLTQTSFEGFFGIADAGQVAYSASGTGGPAGGFDSVWLDSVPVAVEGDPTGFDANFWRFASRPGVTRSGTPYFAGGVTSTSGGSTENYGLYFGLPALPVFQGGDALPGLPLPLGTSSSVDFDYRYSADGTHLLAPVRLASGSTLDDDAITLDGAGLVLGGTLVREGELVPLSVGGDGVEAWDGFDFCGVTEAGRYFFTGDTDGATATDEFVLRDGLIVHREGDVLDGWTLTGAIEGAFLNEANELAFVWDVDDAGTAREALYVEGVLLLLEGDPVDWDGDGVLDPGTALTDFTGISAVTVSPDRRVYFTADVDVNGSVLEGFFCLPYSSGVGDAYCAGDGSVSPCPCGNESLPGSGEGCANSAGRGALLAGDGSASAAADDLLLEATQLPPNQNGIVFVGQNDPLLLFGDGLRCVGQNVFRFPVQNSGASGVFTQANVASTLGLAGGELRYFQAWYRDPQGPCGGTFNFSNGLAVQFLP